MEKRCVLVAAEKNLSSTIVGLMATMMMSHGPQKNVKNVACGILRGAMNGWWMYRHG